MGKVTWSKVKWTKIHNQVRSYQLRIYRASLKGDRRTVHILQHRLLNSFGAKLLAVKRVTKDSKGKFTPGVDHKVNRTKLNAKYFPRELILL